MSDTSKKTPWTPFLEGLGGLKTGPGALVAKEWEAWIGENFGRAERLAKPILSQLRNASSVSSLASTVGAKARELTQKDGDVAALQARIAALEATVARLKKTHTSD